MKKIIEKVFSYDIYDNTGKNNFHLNNFDLFVLSVYFIISIFNACGKWFPISTISSLAPSGVTSIPVIVLNFFMLVRLNIGILIKRQDEKKRKLDELKKDDRTVDKIISISLNNRIYLIQIGVIINIVIILFNFVFKNTVEESLSVIVIVTVIETFINGIIDNWCNRYSAVPVTAEIKIH